MKKIVSLIDDLSAQLGTLMPEWVVLLIIRISLFFVFWPSAQSRIYGLTVGPIEIGETTLLGEMHFAFWALQDTAFYLFDEFNIPLLSSTVSAYMATITEFFFALFILFGLFTRFSALVFIGMTVVIQLFAMPGSWAVHLMWLALLLGLLKAGPGEISLDYLIMKK